MKIASNIEKVENVQHCTQYCWQFFNVLVLLETCGWVSNSVVSNIAGNIARCGCN